jgi:hypothetical protein
MSEEEKLREAEKAEDLKKNGQMIDKVDQALGVCCEWVKDASGEEKKDCFRCCYWDDNDVATLVCGERLMRDARYLIQKQQSRIKELENQIMEMHRQLSQISQREWNG